MRQDGQRGVLLTVQKAGNSSTLAIVSNILGALPRIKATLPSQLNIRPLFDQSLFVRASLQGVLREGAIAAALTSLGFESTAIGSLFSWQNSIASLGAAALTPVFNGGRIRADVDQARAAYRGSLGQYEKTVLTAFQDVEDQLAALRILSGEAQSEMDAVADAQRAEEIAMNRYKTGLVGYLDVLVAQTTLLSNQRSVAQISGQRMVATVVLVKALGGGWLGVPTPPQPKPNNQSGKTATNPIQ